MRLPSARAGVALFALAHAVVVVAAAAAREAPGPARRDTQYDAPDVNCRFCDEVRSLVRSAHAEKAATEFCSVFLSIEPVTKTVEPRRATTTTTVTSTRGTTRVTSTTTLVVTATPSTTPADVTSPLFCGTSLKVKRGDAVRPTPPSGLADYEKGDLTSACDCLAIPTPTVTATGTSAATTRTVTSRTYVHSTTTAHVVTVTSTTTVTTTATSTGPFSIQITGTLDDGQYMACPYNLFIGYPCVANGGSGDGWYLDSNGLLINAVYDYNNIGACEYDGEIQGQGIYPGCNIGPQLSCAIQPGVFGMCPMVCSLQNQSGVTSYANVLCPGPPGSDFWVIDPDTPSACSPITLGAVPAS